MSSEQVLVVGAGISGVAAANALTERGVAVRVVERGRVPGGRMASRQWGGRRIDLGASYLTAEPGTAFGAVVADWVERGLAREWTDTFAVAGPLGITGTTTGPVRYSAPSGLRALVADLGSGLDIRVQNAVDAALVQERLLHEHRADARLTVLAMPDPQAARLLPADSAVLAALEDFAADVPPTELAVSAAAAATGLPGAPGAPAPAAAWEPVIAVALRFEERFWDPRLHGVFVNDSDEIGFIADDGDRRGDGAPVLVVHTTGELARRHLDDPDAAVPAVLAATLRVLGGAAHPLAVDPVETYAHRWTFAKPTRQHDESFLLEAGEGLGVCGDAWGARSSVGGAWASGAALGAAIAAARD